jgi:hypothetical protein
LLYVVSSTISYAGEEDLNDLQNAKVAHMMAKQRMLEAQMSDEDREKASSNKGSCGSVNVGNVSNQRGARGPKEVIVVVKGDVINANNKCR